MTEGPERFYKKMARRAYGCLERPVYFYKLNLKQEQRTALASYPRSGNTWLRYLLEEATGRSCGSIYEERIMPREDEGIAIKTHMLDAYQYSRAIHLVRNPFDVIESYYYWKKDYAGAQNMSWDRFVSRRGLQWARHTRYWMKTRRPVCRLRYEDLAADTLGQLKRVTEWLGFDVPEETLQRAVESGAFKRMKKIWSPREQQHFFRKGSSGDSMNHFTADQVSTLLQQWTPLLREWGYTDVLEQLATEVR